MLAATVGLKALDRIPALLVGAPHGVRVYRSIAHAQRALRARIWMPGYFPDTLAWPPTRIDATTAPPAVAVRVSGRRDAGERLVVYQSIETPSDPPASLLAPAELLESADVTIAGRAAVLARVATADGRLLHEVRWTHGSRRIVIRFAGPVEQLMSIASSLERLQQ